LGLSKKYRWQNEKLRGERKKLIRRKKGFLRMRGGRAKAEKSHKEESAERGRTRL